MLIVVYIKCFVDTFVEVFQEGEEAETVDDDHSSWDNGDGVVDDDDGGGACNLRSFIFPTPSFVANILR